MKRSSKNICAGDLYSNSLRRSVEILVLGQRTQRITGISFQSDWQIDNGFFYQANHGAYPNPGTQVGRTDFKSRVYFACGAGAASIRTDLKVRPKESMVIVTNVTVNSFHSGHCSDLELVSSLARIRNSGSQGSLISFCRGF